MNTIDIIILIPLIWAAYNGFKKGLIIEVATLVALAGGIYAGMHFSNYAADYLSNKIDSKFLNLASFGLTFLVVVIFIVALGKFLEKIVNMVALKLVNKVLGAVFGVIKTYIIISVLLLIFSNINQLFHFVSNTTTSESLLYTSTVETTEKLLPSLKQITPTEAVIGNKAQIM